MARDRDDNVTGIFPPILQLIVRSCCGECRQHGCTNIDYLSSGLNVSAIKSTEKQVREAIDDVTELSFPVYGRMEQTDYSNEYGFAPLVQSAGVAFIVAGDEPGAAAKMVVKAVFDLWPLIVAVFISAFFSGIIMWLLVSFSQFICCYFLIRMFLISNIRWLKDDVAQSLGKQNSPFPKGPVIK